MGDKKRIVVLVDSDLYEDAWESFCTLKGFPDRVDLDEALAYIREYCMKRREC